jgi:hypothetical protein
VRTWSIARRTRLSRCWRLARQKKSMVCIDHGRNLYMVWAKWILSRSHSVNNILFLRLGIGTYTTSHSRIYLIKDKPFCSALQAPAPAHDLPNAFPKAPPPSSSDPAKPVDTNRVAVFQDMRAFEPSLQLKSPPFPPLVISQQTAMRIRRPA